ncbi:MAG: ornithine carbamoyltransferase [Dehalococcoidales bacterium]|nr:MAG: ornithine carbamoyltransferase [Dehalococcoidales bacterium]
MKHNNLLSISDLSGEEILSLIYDAVELKKKAWTETLKHKALAILFEKQSARTRVSFDLAMNQLGGHAIYLSQAEVGLGTRETVPDVARVLGRYVDAISARTYSHRTIEILAEYAGVPVINALSDCEHPCQALADLQTIYEQKGTLRGITLAYIGDGNNIANSLALASGLTGMNFRIASPEGYNLTQDISSKAEKYAAESGSIIMLSTSSEEAVTGADIVYTDTWTSMGQESEAEKRRKVFADYQVNEKLMKLAKQDAIFMHCLPAHRGEEVTDEVMESEQSVVFDQAENRLHAQKALLVKLLGSN